MNSRHKLATTVAVLAAGLTGCGGSDQPATTTSAAPPPSAGAPTGATGAVAPPTGAAPSGPTGAAPPPAGTPAPAKPRKGKAGRPVKPGESPPPGGAPAPAAGDAPPGLIVLGPDGFEPDRRAVGRGLPLNVVNLSQQQVTVTIPALDLSRTIAAGEGIQLELPDRRARYEVETSSGHTAVIRVIG